MDILTPDPGACDKYGHERPKPFKMVSEDLLSKVFSAEKQCLLQLKRSQKPGLHVHGLPRVMFLLVVNSYVCTVFTLQPLSMTVFNH